jgi:hypothetical protein
LLLESLSPEVQADVRLGLVSATQAQAPARSAPRSDAEPYTVDLALLERVATRLGARLRDRPPERLVCPHAEEISGQVRAALPVWRTLMDAIQKELGGTNEAGWKTSADLEHQIMRLIRRGSSERRISRALGVTRELVKRVVQGSSRAAAAPHTALPAIATAPAATPRASKLDAHEGCIEDPLAEVSSTTPGVSTRSCARASEGPTSSPSRGCW